MIEVPPTPTAEPAIGALKAQAYFGQLPNNVSIELVLADVGTSFLVVETIATSRTISTAQREALNALLKGVTRPIERNRLISATIFARPQRHIDGLFGINRFSNAGPA